MKDYSQFGEQAAILAAFGFDSDGHGHGPDKADCRFLDIGAWHPTEFSNTRALYELGWFGVMIEPSPGPVMNLLNEYGGDERVALVQAAVAIDSSPLVRLHVTDDAVSTSSDAEFQKWKGVAHFRGALMVRCLTLTEIANLFGGFDFWNIDAEGLSAELFLQMLTLGYFPPCICVEHDSRLVELATAATREHYTITFSNSTNAVFVRK